MKPRCSNCGRFARISEPFLIAVGEGVLKIQIVSCWHCEPGLAITPQPPNWVTDDELATTLETVPSPTAEGENDV